jgi:hypothetical protein
VQSPRQLILRYDAKRWPLACDNNVIYCARLSAPILFGLALRRRRTGVLELEPILALAAAVGRAEFSRASFSFRLRPSPLCSQR